MVHNNKIFPAYNGHTEMCSLLLDQGAEVDKETTKDYFTALMLATLAGY
jgi:ankyrin repeat protein